MAPSVSCSAKMRGSPACAWTRMRDAPPLMSSNRYTLLPQHVSQHVSQLVSQLVSQHDALARRTADVRIHHGRDALAWPLLP